MMMRISLPARPTRKRGVFLALAGLWLLATPALAQIPGGANGQPTLPDPVPGRGADYPPSAATATTAYGGPALLVPASPCTEYNPCATASSAPRPPDALERKLAARPTPARAARTRSRPLMASSGMAPEAR